MFIGMAHLRSKGTVCPQVPQFKELKAINKQISSILYCVFLLRSCFVLQMKRSDKWCHVKGTRINTAAIEEDRGAIQSLDNRWQASLLDVLRWAFL